MDYSKNFLTEEQIDDTGILAIPLSNIKEMLNEYIYFKGIIELDNSPLYADGYFILEESFCYSYEFSYEEIERDLNLTEADWPDTTVIKAIKGTPFSNNEKLIDKSFKLQKEQELESVFYSYEQLVEISNKIKLPEPKLLSEISKKKFNYNVGLENKKSIFTVQEALLLISNISSSESVIQGYLPDEYRYYLKSLCDCIKGQHETGFHLITKELWVKSNDEFGEEFSRWYENGTCLKASVDIDMTNTLISKAELIRWCEFMEIETGLEINSNEPTVSIEALEIELNSLRSELLESTKKHAKELRQLEESRDQLKMTLESTEKMSLDLPAELKLAVDAYKELIAHNTDLPRINDIKNWLSTEAKSRGIVHTSDGQVTMNDLSEKKKEVIASIIRS